MQLETTQEIIAGNLIMRPVRMDDIETAVELFRTCNIERNGVASDSVERLRVDWETPGLDLASSLRGVFTPEGRMIALGEIWDVSEMPVRPYLWVYVMPEYRQRGIGTRLLQWAEQRARQVIERVPAEARVVLESAIRNNDEVTKEVVRKVLGMQAVDQSWWHMLIDMDADPSMPASPEGVRLMTFADFNDARGVYGGAGLVQRSSWLCGNTLRNRIRALEALDDRQRGT